MDRRTREMIANARRENRLMQHVLRKMFPKVTARIPGRIPDNPTREQVASMLLWQTWRAIPRCFADGDLLRARERMGFVRGALYALGAVNYRDIWDFASE